MKTSTTCPSCRKSTLRVVKIVNQRSGWTDTKLSCPCCKARFAHCVDHLATSAAVKA